jgi:uncharacterized membrane protein
MKAISGAAPGAAPNAPRYPSPYWFIHVTQSLTKIWVVIGALVTLAALAETFLPQGGLAVIWLIYGIVWVVADLVIIRKLSTTWPGYLERGQNRSLQGPLVGWGVLGLIFGGIPGFFLLMFWATTARTMPPPSTPPPDNFQTAVETRKPRPPWVEDRIPPDHK